MFEVLLAKKFAMPSSIPSLTIIISGSLKTVTSYGLIVIIGLFELLKTIEYNLTSEPKSYYVQLNSFPKITQLDVQKRTPINV